MAPILDREVLVHPLGQCSQFRLLQMFQDNFLESIQPVNMQGLWVYNHMPGSQEDVEIDRIASCPKESHLREKESCGLCGSKVAHTVSLRL